MILQQVHDSLHVLQHIKSHPELVKEEAKVTDSF